MPKPIRSQVARRAAGPRGVACVVAFAVLGIAASSSSAITLTPLTADSFVHGEIVGPVGPFSQTDISTDLEPNLRVFGFRSGGNVLVESFLSASIQSSRGIPSVTVWSGQIARTSGLSNNAAISYGYTLRFDLDAPTRVRLVNGIPGGEFPEAGAAEAVDSASLSYELRATGGATVFLYAAPLTNAAGTYADVTVAAGSYEFVVTGAAAAIGNPCCVLHNAQPSGIVRLEFQDALALVPSVSAPAAALLVALLATAGAFGLHRKRLGESDRE